MLYDSDDKDRPNIMDSYRDAYNAYAPTLNVKKLAIFITSAIFCLIILVGSFILSYHKIAKPADNVQETSAELAESEEVANEEKIVKTEHVQIARHSADKIRAKFIPEYNENAQEDIKNLYFSTEKVAYLTFDDGPSATITPQILDTLKRENVPATFFVVGARVNMYPNIVKRAYEEGHFIANHGYSHSYSKIYQSVDTIFDEFVQCENAVRAALGIEDFRMYLFRYPGGSSGGRYADIKAEAKSVLNSYAVTHTNWNCMTGDAEGKNTVEDQLEELKKTMEGDDTIIVLMHDASDKQVTSDALPEIINYLREQGYTFKNFYEIF